MARKERKDAAMERLEGLIAAGDWRAARAEVARMDGAGAGSPAVEGEPGPLERMRARLTPSPAALVAFVGGLVFLAVVAVAGLRMR